MADRRRQAWLLLTTGLTGGAFAITIALAPPSSAPPGRALGFLLFTGSAAHVAATGWLFTIRSVRSYAAQRRVRFLWLPTLFVAAGAIVAAALPPGRFAWLLLPFFGWQFYHFQKQNLGMVALAAASAGAAGLGRAERRLLIVAGLAGTAGILAHPGLLDLTVNPRLGALYPVCGGAYGVVVAAGAGQLLMRQRLQRPAAFCVTYLMGLGFFVPVFLCGSPYAAVGGMTVAHGMQYLLLLGFIAGSPPRLGALGNVAMIGGALLSAASHLHGAGAAGRAVFGAYLGAVMAHFVIDAGVWRLRDPFPRAFLTQYAPYLVLPATADGRSAPSTSGSAPSAASGRARSGG